MSKRTTSEQENIIEYSDGFKWQVVSKTYAQTNWKKESIYRIYPDEESESLIEDEVDLATPGAVYAIELPKQKSESRSEKVSASLKATTEKHVWAETVEIVENAERKGIELRFNAKPHPELQTKLRAIGFRPGKRQGLWYMEDCPIAREFGSQVKEALTDKPEGPDLFLKPSFVAVRTNIEKKDFSFVLISLNNGENKNYIVFEPSKPRAEVIATNFARKEFRENFHSLAIKPRTHTPQARMLFDEGKIIQVKDTEMEPETVITKPQRETAKQKETVEKISLKEIQISTSDFEHLPDYKPSKFNNWNDADLHVRNLIGRSSNAYYKITWADGQVITGAMDLEPGDFYKGKENVLSGHIQLFYGNLSRHIPDLLYGEKAVSKAKLILQNYQLNDDQSGNNLKPQSQIGKGEEALAFSAFNKWLSNTQADPISVERKTFDKWFATNYPQFTEKNLEPIWQSFQSLVRTLKHLKRAEEGKSKIQPYSSIYSKLQRIIPGLIESLKEGKLEHGKSKLNSAGMMDLNLDYLQQDKNGNYIIALSHYYEQNGDMIADPDMQIRILPEMEAAEAMTYQDSFGFQQVYHTKEGKEYVDLKKKKDLNVFLNQWLTNLIKQGHKIDISALEENPDDDEVNYNLEGYKVLCKFMPGLEALLQNLNNGEVRKFVTDKADKKIDVSIQKKDEAIYSLQFEEHTYGELEIQYEVNVFPRKKEAEVSFEWLNNYFAGRYNRWETYVEVKERDGDIVEEMGRAMCQWLEERIGVGYEIDLSNVSLPISKTESGSFDYSVKGDTGELTFNPYIMARCIMESKENLLYSIFGSRFNREHLKGRSFSPEEILFLKNMFIAYVLNKLHMENYYDVLYRKEKDHHYEVKQGETYSEEVQKKNERDKNGWIHTLAERQSIKEDFKELGLTPLMTGVEAFEKHLAVIALVHRYDDAYAEYEEKIEKPLKAEIGKLNKKIISHKNDKSKNVGKTIKNLKSEVTKKDNYIQRALRIVEDEYLVFQDEVWDEVREITIGLGYKLDDPSFDVVAYREAIMEGLFDNRMMENYSTELVKKVVENFIREYFQNERSKNQEKKTIAPIQAKEIRDIICYEIPIPAILVPIGVPEPFISDNFFSGDKEIRAFTELKKFTDNNLDTATPQQLFQLVQMAHPTDYGFKVSRMALLEVFEQKGEEIFHALGYPVSKNYPYVNINVGYKSVETVGQVIHEYNNSDKWWSLAEGYRPVGDMKRALEFLQEQIEEERKHLKTLENSKTGKPKGKDKPMHRDIEYTIREYEESKKVIEDYLASAKTEGIPVKEVNAEKEEAEDTEEDVTDPPFTNSCGVYTKATAGENYEEIIIPFPKGAQYRANVNIAKTSMGDFRMGCGTDKKFGDSNGTGYAPSVDGEVFPTRIDALKEGLIQIKERLVNNLKSRDSILNNEEVKNKRVLMAIEALEKFATENNVSLEKIGNKKDGSPKIIIKGLETTYWTKQDKKHPVDKIIIDGVAFNQARLRSNLLEKFGKLPLDTQLAIADELRENFEERRSLSDYLGSVISIKKVKGDDAKRESLQSYLDDMIIDNDLTNHKPGVLKSLIERLTDNKETLVDLPQTKPTQTKPITKETVKPKNQFALNKEIESLVDAKDKKAESFSEQDKLFISQYTGSGGLIKQGASGRGVLYEYYTPDEVVKKMWGLAYRYGYVKGRVLEPACGIGNFLKYAPNEAIVFGYETNHYSARIAQVIYPNFHIHEKSFESIFFAGNVHLKDDFEHVKYSLVIGNPPYGDFTGKYAGMGEKKWTKATQYEEYFTLRCLDLLEAKGLLVFILPSSFMDNKERFNKAKEKADLIDAYRLPTGIFKTTDIGTDIVVFKKK